MIEISVLNILGKPFTETPGEKAPLTNKSTKWVIEKNVINCLLCYSTFNLFWIKHRCLTCGLIICEACEIKYEDTPICKLCFNNVNKPDANDEIFGFGTNSI